MALLERLRGHGSVAIIGMSKNSGKTVTLNALLAEAEEEEVCVGLTSIGRDGERIDVVTETEKPTIFMVAGSLVATTTRLLELSEAVVEILEITPYATPLGDVIIGRVRYDGNVQISGPQTLAETRILIERMRELGADLAIVDGAIDRRTSAAPEICSSAILAAGASVDRSMETVIEKTAHVARLLNLPALEEHRPLTELLFKEGRYGTIDDDGTFHEITLKTSLGAGRRLGEAVDEHTKYLVVSGALTDRVLEEFLQATGNFQGISIVVSDGTKVFIERITYLRLLRRGMDIVVHHRTPLVAVTVNPYATQGYRFDPFLFREEMAKAIPGIPVYDVMMGGGQ